MAFNEEIVVRVAAASTIPLISAVGHETDTTLIDFASDRRAPTPTAAAEMAVPVRSELVATVLDLERRSGAGMARLVDERRVRVEGLGRGLGDPMRLLEGAVQRLDDRAERLIRALPLLVERRRGQLAEAAARLRHPGQMLLDAARQFRQLAERLPVAGGRVVAEASTRFAALSKLLDSYSYQDVLRRGYALVRDAAGTPITDPALLTIGTEFQVEFRDRATVGAVVTRKAGKGDAPAGKPKAAARRPRAAAAKPRSEQGDLF
jgi:exodeoxyribonuclease VII large subunit